MRKMLLICFLLIFVMTSCGKVEEQVTETITETKTETKTETETETKTETKAETEVETETKAETKAETKTEEKKTEKEKKVIKTTEGGCSEEKQYWDMCYLESLEKHKNDNFDEKFIKLYESENITVNGKEFESRALYISTFTDGSTHLHLAGEKTDALSGEKLPDGKNKNGLNFSASSLFHKLYLDGKIQDTEVTVTDEDLNAWDGKRHTATRDLLALEEADEKFREKYGD